jgi:hypothetical protein
VLVYALVVHKVDSVVCCRTLTEVTAFRIRTNISINIKLTNLRTSISSVVPVLISFCSRLVKQNCWRNGIAHFACNIKE